MDFIKVARKAIEKTYNCTCNIIEQEEFKKENKSTGFRETIVLENKKCKISFETITNNSQDDVKANVKQVIKLFIAPEIVIKNGSKIEVTNFLDKKFFYKSSGEPAIYKTHQEVVLELEKRYS